MIKNEETRKNILLPVGILVVVILSALTWHQCGYWKNSIELFSHTLQVTKDNAQAHNNFGLALFVEGKTEEAIFHYNKAICIEQDRLYYSNRGDAYRKLGQYQRAIEDYNESIRLNPDFNAYYDRGNAYEDLGQHQQAIEDYNEAIRLKPDFNAYYNRGNAYTKLKQYQLALKDYNEVIRLNPDYAEAYNNRGVVYFIQGNKNLGCRNAQKACELGKCKILEMVTGKGDCR